MRFVILPENIVGGHFMQRHRARSQGSALARGGLEGGHGRHPGQVAYHHGCVDQQQELRLCMSSF